jgi:hypothetical protein
MPEYCTCGTRLVENARFCHRCGRPVSELANAEAMAEAAPPEPVLTQATANPTASTQPTLHQKIAQLPVSFSNPVALRVAFLMSLAIIPLQFATGPNPLWALWWLAAGWCAVLLYRRLTGSALTIAAGARLGSITGVLTFVTLAIMFTAAMAFAGKEFFDQMKQMAKRNPDTAQMLNDPTMVFIVLIIFLVMLGALVVGFCAAGGALGARFTARKANS